MMRRAKTIFWVSAVLMLGVAALAFGKLASVARKFSADGGVMGAIDNIRDPSAAFPQKDRVTILLIGTDYERYISKTNRALNGMPYTKDKYGNPVVRSDTLLLLSLDLATRQITGLSIPRDTYIRTRRGKINAAYREGGAALTRQTVGELLGVVPDYYVALKPDAVRTIVDAVGGVTVTARGPMKYDDNWGQLHIDLPSGTYEIDGDQAIGFTRYRHPNDGIARSAEDGDDRRMERQQQLIRAMVSRAKQPTNLLRADQLVDTALSSVETNLSRPQILALIALFRGIEPDQMRTATILGENDRRPPYFFYPDADKMRLQVDWLLRGDEAAGYRLTTVEVKNATPIVGAARAAAEALRVQGFDARSGGNTDPVDNAAETRIVYHKAAVEDRARRVAALIGGGSLIKEAMDPAAQNARATDAEPDVTVMIGRDIAAQFADRSAQR